MEPIKKKRPYKKIAFVLSLCAILLWTFLGTGASLAWFSDHSEKVVNIFHTADFELTVSYRLDDGTYEKVTPTTKVFGSEDLFEPGFVQVVVLKIENTGDRAFDFKAAVSVKDLPLATNVFGDYFNLREHLLFGAVFAETEGELDRLVNERALAVKEAASPLSHYDRDVASMAPGEDYYMALIVRMPEEVGNEANYRGLTIPQVELSVIISATQKKN